MKRVLAILAIALRIIVLGLFILIPIEVYAQNTTIKFNITLKLGTHSNDVKILQTFLKQSPAIYPQGLVTGYFGPLTEAAVKKFQKSYSIEQVGIVGPKTKAKLNELVIKTGFIIDDKGKAIFNLPTTSTSPNIPPNTPAELPNNIIQPTTTVSSTTIPATSSVPYFNGWGGCVWGCGNSYVAPPPDITAPVISNIQTSTISTSTVTITWNTDESADSEIFFTPTSSTSTPAASSTAYTTNHSLSLTGLSVAQTYTYVVVSKDTSGNTATSSQQTFTTSPVIVQISSSGGYIVSTLDGEEMLLPAGVTTGTVLIRHHRVTLAGAGMASSTLVPDVSTGQKSAVVFPYPPQTGDSLPVTHFTAQDLTINMASLPAATAAIGAVSYSGPALLTTNNLKIINYSTNSIALNLGAVSADVSNLTAIGDGRTISLSGTTGTFSGITVEGGTGVAIVSASGPTTTVTIDNINAHLDYWAGPASESVSSTAFGDTWVDIASHPTTTRTLYDVIRILEPVTTGTVISDTEVGIAGLQQFDRIEAADGTWAEVESTSTGSAFVGNWHKPNSWSLATSTPNTDVTAYRISLGRLMGWTTTRLTVPRWRTIDGQTTTPNAPHTGQRVEIRLASQLSNRDVDSGGIHFTAPTVSSSVSNSYFRGGFSDQVTLRGLNNSATNVTVELGQDMGYTVDGTNNTFESCTATASGFNGFTVLNTAVNPVIRNSVANNNSTQVRSGVPTTSGWGLYSYITFVLDNFTGSGNYAGLYFMP